MNRCTFPFLITTILWTTPAFASPQPTGPEFPLDTTLTYDHARNDQRFPAVTFDGSNYLVVWQDLRRETDYDIFGTRLAFDGRVLDPGGIIISMAPEFQSYPAIASGLSNSMVVWVDGRNIESGSGLNIYGSRVTPSGGVLNPGGILISDALSNSKSPAISFGGSNYLVVWQAFDSNPLDVRIYGVRLALNGMPIDANPFQIPSTNERQYAPSIAFDGTNYLVVWDDYFDIYGARVSPSGMILDTLGITISYEVDKQWNSSVAFDGMNYLVVWQNESDTSSFIEDFDIHGRRIAPDGTLLDTIDIIISRDTSLFYSEQILPSVSFDGSNFLVTWMDNQNLVNHYDLYGGRVAPDGNVLDAVSFPVSISQEQIPRSGIEFYPAAASNGANHLVAWMREDSINAQYNILGQCIDIGGSLLDTIPISISNSNLFQEFPDLTFGGNNALVTWGESHYVSAGIRVPGIRIDAGGNLFEPIPFRIDSVGYYPYISFDGTKYFVGSSLQGFHVDTSGFVVDSFPVPVGGWNRTVSSDGSNNLILWNTGQTIEGLRIDPTGTVLDSPPIHIAPDPPWWDANHPAVVFDGTNYLASWISYSLGPGYVGIVAGRISTDGIPLDSGGIFISQNGPDYRWYKNDNPTDIAFNGTQYLVVWEDRRNDDFITDNNDIFGSRMDPDGTVIDTSGIPISTEAENQLNPSITYDGKNFLVVWEDYRNGLPDVYGTEVTSNGVVLDPGGVIISEGVYPNRFPKVAKVGDGRSLVVYQSFRPKPDGSDRIYGRLFESSVGVEEEKSFPIFKFRLFQNRPNPFINSTTILYTIPSSSRQRSAISGQQKIPVRLVVYDIMGRRVKILVDEKQAPGVYQVEWDSKNQASGVYFYQLRAGDNIFTQKMILLK
jgi:hypothetical protein